MSSKYLWRVRCTGSHDNYRYRWLDNNVAPTVCVDNDSHTINTTTDPPRLIKTDDNEIITINEGSLTTTGKYNLTHISQNITPGVGAITTMYKSWDYNVGALQMSFDTTTEMIGDQIGMFFNKFIRIGVITANINVPTAWISQNYVVGDAVLYTFNSVEYTYTCINNTVSSDTPRVALTGLVNDLYWRKGLRISLSPDQILRVNDGYMAQVSDGVNTDYLGEIWYVDTIGNYIYVGNKHTTDTPITHNYLASSPTFFYTGYQMIGDCENGYFEINKPWHRVYGGSKVGTSLVKEEIKVSIEYVNVDGAAGKRLVAEVEILRGSGSHQVNTN